MKQKLFTAALLVLLAGFNSHLTPLQAQGTAFTYQGRLDAAGSPANGIYDLQFALFDAASGGTQQSGTWTQLTQGVTNGLFTVELDFGSFFPGASRWLQIGVRTNGGSSFTTLTPRQKFAATPYAITAGNFSGSITAAQLPAGVVTNSASGVNLTGNFSGNGANVTNVNAATLGGLSSAGFWKTNGNTGANPATGAFLGTADNQALEIRVNNVRGLRIEPDPRPGNNSANIIGGNPSNRIEFPGSGGSAIVGGGLSGVGNVIRSNSSGVFIGAGSGNEVGPNADDVVIAGGYGNAVRSSLGAIGGGALNQVQTNTVYATIGGGYANSVQSGSEFSTIGGGGNNNVQSNAWRGTVSGGVANTVGAPEGTVAGGAFNSALAFSATIGGGGGNAASGEWSTIAGGRDNLLTNANYATIGGGYSNVIQTNSDFATIGGGGGNTVPAVSHFATIPGGRFNSATNYAFAAGTRAKANHTGAFVWADSTDADFLSTGANQFLIRAGGGVGINANNPTAALHVGGIPGTDGIRFPNGTLQTTAPVPVFASGYGLDPTTTNQFLALPVTVTVNSTNQRILVTSHKALGSAAVGGANNLNLWIGYRIAGTTVSPTSVGGGTLGNQVPQGTRVTMGLSAMATGLSPGNYEVGLMGNSSSAANWNNNEWGYTTATVY